MAKDDKTDKQTERQTDGHKVDRQKNQMNHM